MTLSMSSADEVLKRQAAMSQWSGAARVAEWLLVLGLVLLVGSALSAFGEGENILRAIVGPLLIIAMSVRTRDMARIKSRELERGLS
jgi:hypothetical protein